MSQPNIVGADCDEGPPVPIPNTEVKLISVEDTWRAAARENRTVPTLKEQTEKSVLFLSKIEVCSAKRASHAKLPCGSYKRI